MNDVLSAISNILGGSEIDNEIDGLIERRTFRRGRRIRKKIKGRWVTQHRRIYRGRVDPRASLKAVQSARRSRNKRKQAQRKRWRTKRR